jgi:hypothetical protein
MTLIIFRPKGGSPVALNPQAPETTQSWADLLREAKIPEPDVQAKPLSGPVEKTNLYS